MRLPPLHALVCFERAGRHMSIKTAAEELHLTPAAVSQQVSKLEGVLGVPLFARGPRRIALTDAGRLYLHAIHPALRQIEQATERVRQDQGPNVITVTCTSGFAMQWLLPRLPRYVERDPGVDVRISTTNRKMDLLVDGIDFAVRHGLGRYPGLEVEKLVDDRLTPVCSPSLLLVPRGLSSPLDLRDFTLLHDEHRMDWDMWLKAVGANDVDANVGPIFVDSNGVIEAALAGSGIALVRLALVEEEIAAGRLVAPFHTSVATPIAYYLVYDGTAMLQRRNRRFRDWLVAEAEADRREYVTD
ncbi:Glycine cleavage system transcriptional activator [Thiomonas sp. CB3]|jgi:LysR family glycine cleavage system transcriptional activator|nr:Glycine cleavage system transcriptional activator [Thiomonas sp. CB3]